MTTTERTGHRPHRVLTALVNLALVLTALAAAAWLAPSVVGYDRYVITGGSMGETIPKGSVVFSRQVPVADLEVGDVITYLPPAATGVTGLVTHRVQAVHSDDAGERTFRTQGDANPKPDPWRFALTSPVQPVVAFHVPLVGHGLIALADRTTRVVLIGVPAALVALWALVELARALVPGGGSRPSPTRPATTVGPSRIVGA